jgi:hypothetical protein
MKRYTSLIVTGHSEKLSGICFVADTDDHDKAMQMLCDAWNKTEPEGMHLVTTQLGVYLVYKNITAEDLSEHDEVPRRQGWVLYCSPYRPDTVITNMPW